MKKENLLEKRDKAIKEYHSLDKRTNLTFGKEKDEIDILEDLTQENSLVEIDKIRFFMFHLYAETIRDITEDILDSFLLINIKEENDQFMKIGEKFDKIFLIQNPNPTEENIKKAKELFEEIFLFYKKIQKNEKIFSREERKEFYGKIAPKWIGIFSAAWIALIGLFFWGGLRFSLVNGIWIVGGWFIISFLVLLVLKKFLKSSPKSSQSQP